MDEKLKSVIEEHSETAYGYVSLFKNWQMAKRTVCVTIGNVQLFIPFVTVLITRWRFSISAACLHFYSECQLFVYTLIIMSAVCLHFHYECQLFVYTLIINVSCLLIFQP